MKIIKTKFKDLKVFKKDTFHISQQMIKIYGNTVLDKLKDIHTLLKIVKNFRRGTETKFYL